MREETCLMFDSICDHIDIDKPVPANLIEHAQKCDCCFFWLASSLAIQRALHTINRVIKNDLCKPKGLFANRLIIAARSLRTSDGVISEKAARDFQHVSSAEIPEAIELNQHVAECEDCRDYHDALYGEFLKLKTEYEKMIREGQSLRPTIEDTAEEINLAHKTFVKPVVGQKPN